MYRYGSSNSFHDLSLTKLPFGLAKEHLQRHLSIGRFFLQHHAGQSGMLHVDLKKHKPFAMEMVQAYPRALMHLSKALQDDEEVVEIAFKQVRSSMMFASPRLQALARSSKNITSPRLRKIYQLDACQSCSFGFLCVPSYFLFLFIHVLI